MINAELNKIIFSVLQSMSEEVRQTDKEAEKQMKRIIDKLVLEGYVNEQE